MSGGAYLTLEVVFGGGRKAEVKYGGGILTGDDQIDLREVLAHDEAVGAVRNIIQELGEHALAEIRQQIAWKHAKEG